MKHLQWFATFAFVLAGIALLCGPSHAAPITAGPAFTPTRFTVVDQGTVGKPDVLLIPGLTSSRNVWAAEAAKLAPNYRLHLVQVDGFAGQPAGANAAGTLLPAIVDELHAYISANKMHPVVMGHSLGGLLTLMLASSYPADPAKIVIVDALPFYGSLFGPGLTPAMIEPQAKQMRDGLAAQTPEQRQASAAQNAAMMVKDPGGVKMVTQNSVDSDAHVFSEAMYEDLTTDVGPQLSKITVPVLMLYPYDPTLTFPGGIKPSQEQFDGIYQGAYKPLTTAKVVRVDDSRHFIMFDQPAKFDALVEAFLSGK